MKGVFSVRNLLVVLAMGVGLLLLSFTLIAGDSQTVLFRNNVLDTIFATPITGTTFMWNMIWFGLALLVLHAGYGAFCWVIGSLSAAHTTTPEGQKRVSRQHVILWFALLTFALLAYNSSNFPRSSLGSRWARICTREIAGIELGDWVAYLALAGAFLASIAGMVRCWRAGWRPFAQVSRLGAAGGVAVLLAGVLLTWLQANHTHNDAKRPNVVLIGIDSLRRDMLSSHAPADAIPNIRAFMKDATSFTDTTTPLARTFPSVMSLLTGRDPHKTGAYMNLPPRSFIKEGDTLGRVLGRAGYRSTFAMDEVRFANIDESYGFDQVIAPRPGATEFMMGMIADTPLSNATMNSFIGRVLFPYVYANRGAAATYDPDTFVARIDDETDFSGSLLFHAHLTLAHWPYSWANSPLPGPKTDAIWPDYYLSVTHRVDQQFADIMEVMRARGVLDNAIVVVYSDHGESFGKPGESLVPVDGLVAALGAKPQWGHGSTVFSTHQYKLVLGMRGYGAAASLLPGAHEVTAPVTIMDIAPTLVQLLGAKSDQAYDGHSLVPLLSSNAAVPTEFAHRVRFTETEYNPVGIADEEGHVNASGVAEAAKIYLIDAKSDRIEVRLKLVEPMLAIRQYAAIGNEYMLAAVPYGPDGLSHQIVLLNLSGARPVLMSGPPLATDPEELHRVWDAMQVQWAGIIPTGEQIAQAVAKSTVAHSGQSSTQNVTK